MPSELLVRAVILFFVATSTAELKILDTMGGPLPTLGYQMLEEKLRLPVGVPAVIAPPILAQVQAVLRFRCAIINVSRQNSPPIKNSLRRVSTAQGVFETQETNG